VPPPYTATYPPVNPLCVLTSSPSLRASRETIPTDRFKRGIFISPLNMYKRRKWRRSLQRYRRTTSDHGASSIYNRVAVQLLIIFNIRHAKTCRSIFALQIKTRLMRTYDVAAYTLIDYVTPTTRSKSMKYAERITVTFRRYSLRILTIDNCDINIFKMFDERINNCQRVRPIDHNLSVARRLISPTFDFSDIKTPTRAFRSSKRKPLTVAGK